MTPDAAVGQLAKIIAGRAEFTEDELYAAMSNAGIPDSVADRAFKFMQTAWGRVLLDGLGIQFAHNYLCFNGAGDVIESGLLADEPYFMAAVALAPRYGRSPGFRYFAMMSADFNAVNSALLAGSKPEDLVTGPVALFMEAATPVGVDKARQHLSKQLAPLANTSRLRTDTEPMPAKPWWRFW